MIDAIALPKVGDKIRVYDSCFQADRIEEVTRIVSAPEYNTYYIYSIRKTWAGDAERLSTPDRIKEIYQINREVQDGK